MSETERPSPILVYSRNKQRRGNFFSKISALSTTDETQSSPLLVYSRQKQRGNFFSKISALGTTYEAENPSPVCVYRRKKQRGTSLFSMLSTTHSTISENSAPLLVYRRKKRQGKNSIAAFSVQIPADQKKNGDSVSAISSDVHHVVHENRSIHVGNSETLILKPLSVNGASKNKNQKILDVDCINDCCSSSKSNLELALASKQTNLAECSSSSATAFETVGEYQSEKDFCISILRSQGQLGDAFPVKISEGNGNDTGESCSLSCKICGHSETTTNMLICDCCEDAFHISCCNYRKKTVTVDEWLCLSCLKKKHLKLRGAERYTTGVRVGKDFQADVPKWSGPVMIDDVVYEPLRIDPSECVTVHDLNPRKPSKLSFICNWLQCRELLDNTEGGANETICGKWRRAPLFAVQTDDWECFCSVFWDPSRADCAAPQELETEEVLKQLKSVEKLRPSLTAERRKLISVKSCSAKPRNSERKMKTRY
ncbi:hypothetical protein ACFE04_027092 [Oxalis oulophora]